MSVSVSVITESESEPEPRSEPGFAAAAGSAAGRQNLPLPLQVRHLGCVEYEPTWRAMQNFNAQRTATTADEIWFCEHPPVFTLGQAGKPEHLLRDIGIPVVHIDRGGQITYHAPGQLMAYLLLDLQRRGLKVRELVRRIEQALIDLLAEYGILAERQPGAPGVYVAGAKIAALGLRIRNGRSYHGLCLNVDMDLSPYAAINPCGYAGLAVTQLRDLHGRDGESGEIGEGGGADANKEYKLSLQHVAARLLHHLQVHLS